MKKTLFFLLIGLVLIAFISLVNMFPNGYIFSAGDVVQDVNVQSNFQNMFFTWNHMSETGIVNSLYTYSIYIAPFYLLSIFGVSPSAQSFLFFFIFLAASL